MECDALDDLIEGVADGERPAAQYDAHLASCAQCQARLGLARALDRVLATREALEPRPGFTGRVMTRVAQEQWRVEQIVDVGFNLALTIGLGLLLAGLAGLAWALGWFGLDQPTIAAVGAVLRPWLTRAAGEAQTVALAAVLLSSTLALWWWVEGGEASF